MEWFALIIPFIVSALLAVVFNRKVHKIELLIPISITVISILIFKFTSNYINTVDEEFWSGKLVEARYYEGWDEYIQQTCECCCDEDGNNCMTYDCSYVDYHPPRWQIVDNNGFKLSVTQSEYNRLKIKFGNSHFRDLRRSYHSIDGDLYYSLWDNSYDKLECVTTSHQYKNRPQSAHSLYSYRELSEEDQLELFAYPNISTNHKQQSLLGYTDNRVEAELQKINALLGKNKQVKIFLLMYEDQPREISYKQESFWKGGNKNEFIITLGYSQSKITWCNVISWSESEMAKVLTRELFEENPDLDLFPDKIKDLKEIVLKHFERKHFSDFDYLDIPLTSTQLLWLFIIAVLTNIGVSIWIVRNDIK